MSDPIGAAIAQLRSGGWPGSITQGGDIVRPREVPVVRPAAGEASFADSLRHALNDVSDRQTAANDAIGAFLRGDAIELHSVMAATEEAQLSLETLVQVRNKLVEAYRTLSSMQG